MNEKNTKRREWVKTAAIIFLSVLLVLTFFSNTFMNYSLPVVASQYVTSGSITAKVRGTGTVEAGDPYKIELTETRVVASVAVKKGDKVEKDQVLFYLEDAESKELLEAEKALDDLNLKYEQEILNGTISDKVVNNAQKGNTSSIASYQARINAANKAETDAQASVTALQAQLAEIDRQISLLEYANVDTSAEVKAVTDAKANLANAQTTLETEKASLTKLTEELDVAKKTIFDYKNGITVSAGDADVIAKYNSAVAAEQALPQLISNAQNVVNSWTAQVNELQVAVTNAENVLNAKTNNASTSNNLKTQKVNITTQKTLAEAALTKATEDKKQLIADIQAELSLGSQNETIQKQTELVEELRAKAVGAEVKAPVAGTVTSIDIVAGETTDPTKSLAVLQPDGKGFALSFSVTIDQAKTLTPGDPAEIQNAWYYNEITATLAQIKNDPENPGKNKLLVFNIDGDVTGGQSLSLSIGQKSANYDMIVPKSAIREDNNGKFVLIVESKSSPLGNRYIATRVDVEVLASDDTQVAISGALYGSEYVITTSNKPVTAGKLVRLADN